MSVSNCWVEIDALVQSPSNVGPWNAAATYTPGTLVMYNGNVYTALTTVAPGQAAPNQNPTAWNSIGGNTYYIQQGPVTYFGQGPFNPANVDAAHNWGMPAGTIPDPQTTEPYGGDIYFDLTSNSIDLLIGPQRSSGPGMRSSVRNAPVVYMGNGPFDPPNSDISHNFGMPAGTVPDPMITTPQIGDIYLSLTTGNAWYRTS